MEHSTLEIIETLREDGAETGLNMLYALQDGEYLAKKPWAQEEVEEACAIIKAVLNA